MTAYRKLKLHNIDLVIIFGIVLTSITAAICGVFRQDIVEGYLYVSVFPIIYLLMGNALYLWVRSERRQGEITIYIFLFLQWLRLVLLPLLGTISGYFDSYGSHITEQAAGLASKLVIYEAIVTFLFCFLLYRFAPLKREQTSPPFSLRGHKGVYKIYILVAAVAFVLTGANRYNFLSMNLESDRMTDTLEKNSSLIGIFIDYGLTFLVILILFYCYEKYKTTGRSRYVNTAIFSAMIRLCIFSSEGRMSQIYLLGIFLLLLPQLFPEYKQRIIRLVVAVALVVIGLMTIYKTFYAFLYDSYLEAVRNSGLDLAESAGWIDVYFYGLKTIARNVTFSQQSSLPFGHVLFDLLRNTFGIHFVFKGRDFTTLEYYNLYIYGGGSASGHLYSSLSYGYLYFGAVLAPMCTCFNIWVASYFERLLRRIKNMDMFYVIAMCFTRFVASIFSNFVQSWNLVSRTIVFFAVIIGVSSMFVKVVRTENRGRGVRHNAKDF